MCRYDIIYIRKQLMTTIFIRRHILSNFIFIMGHGYEQFVSNVLPILSGINVW